MSEYLSFLLSESFIEEYRDKPVDWGFDIGAGNTLSELTFLTKYSRKKKMEQKKSGTRCAVDALRECTQF